MKNRIKELRGELRMTQTRFGEELGVTQETVSSYESGKIYPSFAQLCHMRELFNASIDFIMGLSDIRSPRRVSERDTILERIREAEKQMDIQRLELLNAYAQSLTAK